MDASLLSTISLLAGLAGWLASICQSATLPSLFVSICICGFQILFHLFIPLVLRIHSFGWQERAVHQVQLIRDVSRQVCDAKLPRPHGSCNCLISGRDGGMHTHKNYRSYTLSRIVYTQLLLFHPTKRSFCLAILSCRSIARCGPVSMKSVHGVCYLCA